MRKVGDVASGNYSPVHLGYGRNLSVGVTDRSAQCASASDNSSVSSRCLTVEHKHVI